MKSAAFIALAALMAAPACAANVESSSRTASDRSRTMVHSVVIDAPVREVWGALTTPEGWQRWAVPIAWQTSRRPRIIETSYDLKAGCTPMRPSDPAFLSCYTPVGDFPDVDVSPKLIYTRLITAFGAGVQGVL